MQIISLTIITAVILFTLIVVFKAIDKETLKNITRYFLIIFTLMILLLFILGT